jgi:MFS family permease
MGVVSTFREKMFAAFVVRNFRLFFIGQLVSVSGTWMQQVAQNVLIYQLTHSPVDLGFSAALQFLPMLLFGSYGGLIADRFEKRRILYVTQACAGTLALVLGLLVSTHHVTLDRVFLMGFLLGIVNMFDNPARQSFVQEMVGRDLMANAVSLNSVLMNAGRLVGPSLAGILIALVGIVACFYVNAASYLAVLLALALMRKKEFYPMAITERAKGQLRLGLRYAFETPALRNVIIAAAVVGTLAFNFSVTLLLLARQTFHHPNEYSVLLACMGFGAVLGGLYVAHRSRPTLRLLAVLSTLFGIFMTVVAFAPTEIVADVGMVATGACSIAFLSTANATLQLKSHQVMRGRVMSLYAIAVLGSTPVGSPLVGFIISQTNPRVGIAVGSIATLIVGLFLLASSRSRDLRQDQLVTA